MLVETSVGLEMVWATLTKRQAEALRDSAIYQYFHLLEDDLRVGAALARKGLAVREREWTTYGPNQNGEYVTNYYLTDHGTAVAKRLNRDGDYSTRNGGPAPTLMSYYEEDLRR